MSVTSSTLAGKVALVTGSAKRLGAASVRSLHSAGAKVVVHYHQSHETAQALAAELNGIRADSAVSIGSQLGTQDQAQWLIDQAIVKWARLDIVVNNASSFFPTPFGSIGDDDLNNLLGSNFAAPLFVTQAAFPMLKKCGGSVVNMVDIHGFAPHRDHCVYSAAKSALIMLTRSMALELAPHVRVNGIAPGAILWPEDGSMSAEEIAIKIGDIPLARQGTPDDIANLVVYLSSDEAAFITGEIIKVDGGSSA